MRVIFASSIFAIALAACATPASDVDGATASLAPRTREL